MNQKLEQEKILEEDVLEGQETRKNQIKDTENEPKKDRLLIKSTILLVISLFIVLSITWLYRNTGNVTLEQLLFHLKVPMKGTNTSMVWEYICWVFSIIVITTAIFIGICILIEKLVKKHRERVKKILYMLSKITLIFSIIGILIGTNMAGFIKNQVTATKLIEEQYVDPASANIIFPEEKQNLIYIYLESMEMTFTSKENGGMYKKDKIPELSQIAKENINFSNTEKLGGAVNLYGSQWTIAAMVSQTSGVPLKISIGENDYGNYSIFLPGAYTLGEILEENGYKNYLLLGSDAEFGGRKSYFESHGNYEIWDYVSAVEEKRMTEEEKIWWGYSDGDLFTYAKEQLTEISKHEEPFNYTMLTVDTHFTDGWVCEQCENDFKDQYSNVIRCSSSQVAEFVEWIKEQAFYKNTTIIISGDHLTMQASTAEEAAKLGYEERTVYNAFINAKSEVELSTTNRTFFTIDMYPTTLGALGCQIEEDRLGLGTNLFSDTKTLAEEFGVEYVREELQKKSTFYNKKLLFSK